MSRPKARPFRRSDGTYWARVRYTDESGKTRDRVERAASAADAHAKSNELLKQYDKDVPSQPPPITFNEFADLFRPHVERLRSHKTVLGHLRSLQTYFGDKLLTSITYEDIKRYSQKRYRSVSSRTGRPLKHASVHREVALLRRMFKEAIERGYATKNPYKDGPPLIKPEYETKRDRVLSKGEEERLLAVCIGRRAHLRLLILAAVATRATKSQLLRVTWKDVDINLKLITFRHGKKPVPGFFGKELADALIELQNELLHEFSHTPRLIMGDKLFSEWIEEKRVFRDPKTAFSSACRAAGIENLRFSDLRWTLADRAEANAKKFMEKLAAHRRKNPHDKH
jgi:integrase